MGVTVEASQATPMATAASPESSIGRKPYRSLSRQPTGASSMGITAIGKVRSPACSGVEPRPTWSSCVTRNRAPNNAAYIIRDATADEVNTRLRKKCIGSIGAAVRSSQATKRAIATRPPVRASSTSTFVQPMLPARIAPHTSPNRPTLLRSVPGTSSRRWAP